MIFACLRRAIVVYSIRALAGERNPSSLQGRPVSLGAEQWRTICTRCQPVCGL